MRFTIPLTVSLPRQRVLELLSDPAHRPSWLRSLVAHELIEGREGHVGAVSRVEMRSGRSTMEARERITRRAPEDLGDFPADVVVHYERELVAAGMWSAARERLHDLD